MASREQIEDLVSEKEARLMVVLNILSMETHPDDLRRYREERNRMRARIAYLNANLPRCNE